MPLEPSPTARALLDHARRGALSAVSIGENRLTLQGGRLVAVQGADAGLVAFLVRAGTLTPRDAREFDAGEGDEVLVALRERLGGNVLRRARRAAWIDRLVAALDSEALPSPTTLGPVATTIPGEPVVPILLDALARRAGNRDAGMVGAHADLVFAWRLDENESELSEARRWLTYDPPQDESLARLLVRHPGAAPRLAALARAGFARFVTTDEAAATPRASLPSLGRPSLEPARPPLRQLTPGASVPPPSLGIHDVELPSFADQRAAPLEDPLFALESRITFLEAMNAPGPDRAEAWAASGDAWLTIHGALDESCRAYREAAAADPTDTTALLQSARLCVATGQRELARAYAASATAVTSDLAAGECRRFEAKLALQSGENEHAAALLRDHLELDASEAEIWAFLALETGDPHLRPKAETILGGGGPGALNLEAELSKAELLVRSGHPEAAIHALGVAADAAGDLGLARALRLEAAEHAEFIERPDLAFSLLFDAFIRDASIDVLYEPLAHDAGQADEDALRAVLLERFATLTSGARASQWFLRAAEAFAALPGVGRRWSHELTVRALEADPAATDALEALTEAADHSRDANILADGLERAAVRAPDSVAVPLFERLAGLAESRLGSVHRAAWAWRMVHARTRREDAAREALRLGEKAAVRSSLLKLAEEDLQNASDDGRAPAVRRLAAMLRDHPEQRSRAAALYREYLAYHPDDRSAADALRRLLALSQDPEARLASLSTHYERVASTSDRERALEELTGLLALQGRWPALQERAQAWTEMAPANQIAVARFELAARLVGSADDQGAARRARLATHQRATHAPLWVASAREEAGADAALAAYDRALAIDPRCVPALLARAHLEYGSPADQWARVVAARSVAPTDPHLLARAIDLARTESPDTLTELMRVAEVSPHRARQRPPERFDAACESADIDRAMRALDAWLASVSRPSGMRIVAGARAMAKTRPDDAARILVRATDQTSDPRLLSIAEEYAKEPETQALILERRVIWDDDFTEPLRALAALRREGRRIPSEARTLLRILAEDPGDQEALRRLSEIYGECGEYERLYAVYALQRSASRTAPERERASIALAVIAYRHLREPARARGAMEELATDPASAETAAAVLSKLGDHRSAIDLLVRRADAARRDEPVLAQKLIIAAVTIAETLMVSSKVAIQVAGDALRRGIRGADLMLLFERLTLRDKDRESAMSVYEHLRGAAMGPHGRRGTTYRCARWLERLGDESAALKSYQAAFHDDPGDGVILSSIERLARRSSQLEVWADALTALADRQTHVDHRLRVERRLVALMDLDMGDAGGALDRLTGVWEDTQKSELIPELRKLIQKVAAEEDRHNGVARLIKGLRARIESTWNSDDQAATLGTLAELTLVEGDDPASAADILQELADLMKEEEDIPRRLGAEAFAQCAASLTDKTPATAADYARRALGFDHEHELARRVLEDLDLDIPEAEASAVPARDDAMSFADLAEELGNDLDGERDGAEDGDTPSSPADTLFEMDEPGVAPSTPPSTPPASGSTPAPSASTPPSAATLDASGAPAASSRYARNLDAVVRATPEERHNSRRKSPSGADRWLRPPQPVRGEDELRMRLQSGDLGAAPDLAALLASTPGREREAVAVLVNAFRRAPWRADLLPAIESRANESGATAVLSVTGELRRFIHGEESQPIRDWRAQLSADENTDLIRRNGHPFLDALGHVWNEAGPIFRQTHEELGLVGTERVTALTLGPLGQAATYVSSDIPIFRGAGEGVTPAPTMPPSIIAGQVLDSDSLPFRFAAAAALCAPEHILIAGFNERAEVFMDAVYAAFGPASAANSVSQEAAIQMGELWRVIPARRQTTLRQLVGSSGRPAIDKLRAAIWECAGRAGYLADGRIAESLRFVGVEPESYAEHLQRSAAGMAIVRLAFSDALLAARSAR